jgi:uncharacterized protein
VPVAVIWRARLQKIAALTASVAGYFGEATPKSVEAASASIARGRAAEKKWRETGVAETIPAVSADSGDVAMPLREAYEYYGTSRGAVANYVNAFAVQSRAYTATFDSMGAAALIKVPSFIVRQRTSHEQAAQIAVTLFADTAEPILAPARVLLRDEPDPGREIAPRSEGLRISDASD